jgi:hypothetical protein
VKDTLKEFILGRCGVKGKWPKSGDPHPPEEKFSVLTKYELLVLPEHGLLEKPTFFPKPCALTVLRQGHLFNIIRGQSVFESDLADTSFKTRGDRIAPHRQFLGLSQKELAES